MHYVVKRLGFRVPRALIALLLLTLLVVAGAYWIGPFRARPADLRLLALNADGRFSDTVGIPSRWADTLGPSSEARARFPLVLAIHNAGARPAKPEQLALSLPAHIRVAARGGPLDYSTMIGNPLARYELPLNAPRIEPGAAPVLIGDADTIWLEPVVPTLSCTAGSDSVPEFVAAPAPDPNALSRVRIFYSLEGRSIRQRQAGLLNVELDPGLVMRRPAPPPRVGETVIVKPEAPAPALSELRLIGSRLSTCGEPTNPLQLHTVLWETAEGGRFFVMYHGGTPRKHLFDLNRDSIIELEMWDSDGDGRFEARRPARYAIPSFIMPLPKASADSVAAVEALDTIPLDSAWLDTFHDTSGGPLRFNRPRTPRAPAPQPARPPATADAARVEPVDSAALHIFHSSDAGPLRFVRAQRGDTARTEPRAPPPARAQPRREQPRLLGEPYNPGGQRNR